MDLLWPTSANDLSAVLECLAHLVEKTMRFAAATFVKIMPEMLFLVPQMDPCVHA